MTQTTSILVASDLSIRSERALRRAFRLAEAHGAALTVLHVVDDDLPAAMADGLEAQARAELGRLCASISERPADLRVVRGDTVTALLAALEGSDFGLVVLGTHRPRALWDLFSGTTMERIVRASPVPALLVADAVDHDYANLLAGIDLSPCSAAAIRLAADLAPGAPIHSFHAFSVPFRGFTAPRGLASEIEPFRAEAKAALEKWWDSTPLPETCEKPVPYDRGLGALVTMKLAKVQPDLLVVGAHGRPGYAPTLLGGFTEALLRDPPCDVLVVRC